MPRPKVSFSAAAKPVPERSAQGTIYSYFQSIRPKHLRCVRRRSAKVPNITCCRQVQLLGIRTTGNTYQQRLQSYVNAKTLSTSRLDPADDRMQQPQRGMRICLSHRDSALHRCTNLYEAAVVVSKDSQQAAGGVIERMGRCST